MHFKWSCNIFCDKQDCKIVVNYFSQYCMRAGRAHLGCQWWSLSSADTFHQCFKQIISVNISFIWWILDEKRHSYDPAPQPPNNFKKAEQGDLAKAHQVSCQCFYSILVNCFYQKFALFYFCFFTFYSHIPNVLCHIPNVLSYSKSSIICNWLFVHNKTKINKLIIGTFNFK